MSFDLSALMGNLGVSAAIAGPSGKALALRQRTRQRADQSRAVRTAMIQELLSSGALMGGGGPAGPATVLGGGGGGNSYQPKGLPRGRGLTTITAPNGQRVTVSATYASRLQGLLNDLWRAGYKFKSVGGYNYRNIAGTNRLSKHATGEAIDIDPQPNRGDRLGGGGAKYGYFDPKIVIPIIRKYGFDWGALWSNSDPMHFSTGG